MERIWRWNTEVKKLKWKFIPARICSQKLPWGLNCRVHLQCRRRGFDPWVRKILWRRKWQPTPVFLPGKSHGQRSLAGYSSWDHKRVRHDLVTKKNLTTNNALRGKDRQTGQQGCPGFLWQAGYVAVAQSCLKLFETSWTVAYQAPLSSTISWLWRAYKWRGRIFTGEGGVWGLYSLIFTPAPSSQGKEGFLSLFSLVQSDMA